MVAEIIAVGTELLLGNILNSNAKYLSEKCALLGLSLFHQSVVGDNEERLTQVIETALERADIIILTGGLGPTKDDLTKEVVAKVFGLKLVEDIHSRERIESYFKKSVHKVIPDNNWKQALAPEGSIVIDNHNGTAPGLIVREGTKTAILLPGPPNELVPMFENDIYPYLKKLQPEVISSSMVKICEMGESLVETVILDLIDNQSNPTIATYAKTGEVHLRITAKAGTEEEAKQLISPVIDELRNRFGSNIYTIYENVTLEESIIEILKYYNLTLSTAESCTGGLLSGRIVNVAGASEVFKSGMVTYANDAKEAFLGVKNTTLQTYGAVSEETAREMAEGGAKKMNTDVCVAVTGIAGPDGGTDEKPVGLVYIACYLNGDIKVNQYHFRGSRDKIRDYSVVSALTLLRNSILEKYN